MSTNPTSALVDQLTAGWEQAQNTAQQWWDASWRASDQLLSAWADSAAATTSTTSGSSAPAGGGHGGHGGHDKHSHHGGHSHHAQHEQHGQRHHGPDAHRHDGPEGCGCGCGGRPGEQGRHGGPGAQGIHGGHGAHGAHGCNHPCGCGDECGECDNPCACCVPRADVVVRARAGERRIVPFILRNPTRRERPVTLAVGPWQACGGDPLEVAAKFVDGEAITLGPCETRTVRLFIAAAAIPAAPAPQPDVPTTPDATPTDPVKDVLTPLVTGPGDHVVGVVLGLTDVSRCSTAYADVRFEGCGRPMRVAVVVEPSSCDAVEVHCGCGCC